MPARKTTKKPAKSSKIQQKLERLSVWNMVTGVLLLAQAITLAVASKGTATVSINTNFLNIDSLSSSAAGHNIYVPAVHHLFDIKVVYLVVAFLVVGSVMHLLAVSRYRKTYEANLKKGINKLRRAEYILGGGIVLLTIALLNGVYDASTLIAIFALVEVLGLFSLISEARKDVLVKHPRAAGKLSFVAGFTPWIVIAIYLFGALVYADQALPAYIYFVDGSIFVLTLALAAVGFMQSQNKGKFGDYLYSEQAYAAIGFVLKSALAWQIYFGLLR